MLEEPVDQQRINRNGFQLVSSVPDATSIWS